MKKLICAIALASAGALGVRAEESYGKLPERVTDDTAEAKAGRIRWFQEDRFGMFIHFGLYSLRAQHEWCKRRAAIPDEVYTARYFDHFNPDLFDARAWARQAKAAGMRYMVLTTKHHEGFCLWDTATTDYKITNTAFKRDLVKEYVEACRAEGLKVGFYFSLLDWHDPQYPIDEMHPRMSELKVSGLTGEALEAALDKENAKRDMAKFRETMFAQVRELLTNYGKVDVVWFDFLPHGKNKKYGKGAKDFASVDLIRLVRQLQPGIIVNDRLGLLKTEDGWDFLTVEQVKPEKLAARPQVRGKDVPWEAGHTFSGGSWGYERGVTFGKSTHRILEILVRSVAWGGNLILNVGPNGRGEFELQAQDRLKGVGAWMRLNGAAIYGCGAAPEGLVAPEGTYLTYNAATKRLFLHVVDYPADGRLRPAFLDRIDYAQFLHDASEVRVTAPPDGTSACLELPKKCPPESEIPVIELWLGERRPLPQAKPEVSVVTNDTLNGFARTVFTFGDGQSKVWLIEPKQPKPGNPWVWCMKWPWAFAQTTGQIEALRRGYRYVTFECGFAMTDDLLPRYRALQDYLVRERGLAPKADLIGMSWGGFYSVRYASTYPECVRKIYLDNPLLNFDGFAQKNIGTWQKGAVAWSEDPRLPVNRAEPIAKAGIPILLMYGDADKVVPPAKNCLVFAERFRKAGGDLTVVCRPGADHHPHGVTDGKVGFQLDWFEKQ